MRRALLWMSLLAALAFGAHRLGLLTAVHGAGDGDRAGDAPPPTAPFAEPPPDDATAELGPRALPPRVPVEEGEPFTVELPGPPADRYADTKPDATDDAYAAIVARLGRPGVVYDSALARGARWVAFEQARLGKLVPSAIVEFLLHAAGAIDRGVKQGYLIGRWDADAIQRRLESMLGARDDRGPAYVGIGEAPAGGSGRAAVLGIVISWRDAEVEPAPRRVELGATWTLRGVVRPGFDTPSALVLWPDGRLEDVPMSVADRRFTLDVPAGSTIGTMEVSVGASGRLGHASLFQVPVEVGRPVPRTLETHLPPDESAVRTPEAAEALAFELLNRDRAQLGLPRLVRDPALDAVARAHSLDMTTEHFFGHTSPTTGGPGDRLAAAGYRASGYAENVALDNTMHEAEAGLLTSLGHRRNILGTRVTHVGIGVARRAVGSRQEWHLTQLFARPVVAVDARAGAETLHAAITARRRAAGLPELARDPDLDRIAGAHARLAIGDELDGLPDRVLRAVSDAGLSSRGAQAWVFRTTDLADVKPPFKVADRSFTRAGVGIAQLPGDARGTIGVVVIVSGEPR